MRFLKPSTICRWFGHKRYSLDDDSGNVVNVDGCRRCGVILLAKRARSARFVVKP